MNFLNLFSRHHLAQLHDWLIESGELCIYIYRPHSGSSGTVWFVHSLDELKSLIAKQDWDEIEITIYRRIQYPLRGTVNSDLLARALQEVPNGKSFSAYSLNDFDLPTNSLIISGESHDELEREFAHTFGAKVALGVNPDPHDLHWIYAHPDEVMFFEVKMNQKYYEPFAKDPSKYNSVL